jgi:hypothetical protein
MDPMLKLFREFINQTGFAVCKLKIILFLNISANDAEHTLKRIKLTLSIC